jgi:hypothetical protein
LSGESLRGYSNAYSNGDGNSYTYDDAYTYGDADTEANSDSASAPNTASASLTPGEIR